MSGQVMRLLSDVEDLIGRVRDADPPRPGGAGRLTAALIEAEAACRAYLAGRTATMPTGSYSTSGPPPVPPGYTRWGQYAKYTPPSML